VISSITTSVSTIVSSASLGGILASLGIAGVLTLIASLMMKELAAGEGSSARRFGRNLDIAILPLVFAFCFIVSVNIQAIIA
jgi:hypothetical protein